LDDGSLGAVFTAQVIEHLEPDELSRFLELANRKLGPEGVLIAETVNPHSIQAFKTFWVDRTHRAPIFPEVALVLCRLHRFEEARIVFPLGTGSFDDDRTTQGEYAVVARKKAL
jgi:O-antigen chain-terminating methyltransferase